VTLTELIDGDSTAFTEAVDHLRARGRIELADDGRILAVHGLCLRPTRHRIEHDGGVANTWCALDAIGIPAALAIDARSCTQCPTCGDELAVALKRGEPEPLAGAVLWYPEAACGHLIDDFCSAANLFCSIEDLQRWIGDNGATGRALTLGEVAELGRECWSGAAKQISANSNEARHPVRPSAPGA